jgi:hypothetical protein
MLLSIVDGGEKLTERSNFGSHEAVLIDNNIG